MVQAVYLFFFNDTATTEIYTLSLHDALPISPAGALRQALRRAGRRLDDRPAAGRDQGQRRVGLHPDQRHLDHRRADLPREDRKSTRLNSSHANISYAVFCLKKKKHL